MYRKSLVIFLFGLVMGAALILGLAQVIVYNSSEKAHILEGNLTYKFADATIKVLKLTAESKKNLPFRTDTDKALLASRAGIPFLYIASDANETITSFYFLSPILNENEKSILWADADENGLWDNLVYSGHKDALHKKSEDYIDVNIDGNFDYKVVFGDEIIGTAFIYLKDTWIETDKFNHDDLRAMIKDQIYRYDPNSGSWKKE